jgi:biotin carboxylase
MPPQLKDDQTEYGGVSPVVIVVDPYSSGCMIVRELMNRGNGVIALWTKGFSAEMKTHVPVLCGKLDYIAEVEQADSLEETVGRLNKIAGGSPIIACMVGGEAGVDLADALSEFMGLRTNGTEIPNRRDKHVQQNLIKQTGLRSIHEVVGTKLEDVEHFLKTEQFPLVLKPTESAGSDGVKLCHTYEEAVEHFTLLMSKQLVNGGDCPAVLCQEFLKGKEYVVDTVSSGGVHKTMMCAVYDKRAANGSAFVYFGAIPVAPDSEEGKIIIPYARAALDAIGFKNGPSHGEVVITESGPCLVEMNCRADGGNGNWYPLYKAMTGGYSQIEVAVDAYLDEEKFHSYPDVPETPFQVHGQEVQLVSYVEGIVKATPGYEKIRALPSFCNMESELKPGDKVTYSVDLITNVGDLVLMNKDPVQLAKDVEFIRLLENEKKLFVLA